MVRLQLSERQWKKVELALAAQRGRGRRGRNDRNFVEAVLWWRRTGVPWRDLPGDFGLWKTVFNRFDRWARTGVWERLLAALSQDRDDEWHSIDSTINRAHQHAAGGKGGPPPTRSVVHAAGRRPRFTWWSMRWDCLFECTFNLLKQARRFATRYEKTLRNHAAVVVLGCALLWLRV